MSPFLVLGDGKQVKKIEKETCGSVDVRLAARAPHHHHQCNLRGNKSKQSGLHPSSGVQRLGESISKEH